MDKNNLMLSERVWRILLRLLEEARKAVDPPMSQEQAAVKAGMERQQWSRIVKGKSGTKRPTLERMAKAVDRDLDEMLRAAQVEANINSKHIPAAEKAAEIVNDLARTPKIQEHAMATLQAFHLLSMSTEKEEGEDNKNKRPHHPARRQPPKGEKPSKSTPAPKDDNGESKGEQPIRKNGLGVR